MFEYMIKEAISEYMRETGKSKREAIYKANEIIKALGQECREEEAEREALRNFKRENDLLCLKIAQTVYGRR